MSEPEPTDPSALRLPRAVEADPLGPPLLRGLAANQTALWSQSERSVPVAPLTAALQRALVSARAAGQVGRGLETAQKVLAAEGRGLALADARSDAVRGVRVSRLVLMSNDGSERFYRQVDALLRASGPRLLAIRVEAGADELGGLLFGPGRIARLLLLEHKDGVARALLALAEHYRDATDSAG